MCGKSKRVEANKEFMQPDTQNSLLVSEEFPEDAFLIFIGHSDDATAEAHAIYELQSKLEKDFRTFLKANQKSPFNSLILWEWRLDASSKTGGQINVIDPALNRAQITLFVFKERVGTVTCEELENARKRSKDSRINILVFFPACPPESSKLNDETGSQDWANLKKLQATLTKDWSAKNSTSVTPCLPLYEDIEHLKRNALEKIRDAMRDVIADIKRLTDQPSISTSYLSDRIIGDIKDINFDRRPVLNNTVDELERKLVEKFLAKPLSNRLLQEENHSSYPSNAEKLAALGCVTDNRPTLGAFLCFAPSRLIRDKFGSCSLHVVRYKGTSRTSSAAEIFPMHDNLLNLFERGIYWLVSEAHLGRQGRVGSTDRDDTEIPEIALREALANALVHRDYEDTIHRDQPTRVDVFDNRIEITSFGTLPGSVNIDQLNQYSEKLTPVRRNSVIASIFLNMMTVELNASGIARMRYAMQNALLPPPKINIQNGAVVVCFERPILIDSNTNQPVELRKRALIGGALSRLEPFKKAAIEACMSAGYYPVMMEHHPADVKDAVLLSNTMVDNADIYIGILTHQYGFVPAGYDKSIYEIEYSRVRARKDLPRLLFSLKQNLFIKNNASENKSYSQLQLKFRETVARESDLINISSAEELKTQIINGFKKLAYGNISGDMIAERYRSALKTELGYIRMLGLPGVESIKVNLNDDTFVPLRLSDRQESDNKEKNNPQGNEHILYPDKIMKRAFQDRRGRRMLLVIGDPGAGKTTLLKYYALCALENYKRLGFTEPVNVFYIPLRELVRDKEGDYISLPANLANWAKKHQQTIATDVFTDWLNSGTSLVLLDGLDEISNTADRIEVCKWIDNVWAGFSKAFFVVTSRSTGYNKEEGIELECDYERADVQDFTPDQQERFLKNWFTAAFLKEPCEEGFDETGWQEKQTKEADQRTQTIVQHLQAEKNKGLRQLAAIPMILQIMAILWKDREYLPESRVELYDAALNYLLEFRDRRRNIKPLLSARNSRQVLAPISLWMQEILKKDEASKADMHQAMKEWLDTLDNPPTPEAFCSFLDKRAGLLVESAGKEYLFRHKSFREYLAGIQLKENRPYDQLNKLVAHFGEDWWEEPLRFFMGSIDATVFDAFMEKLFDSEVSEAMTQKQQFLLQIIIEEAKGKKVDALCVKLLDPTTTSNRQRVILDCLKTIAKPVALGALIKFKNEGLAKENKDITGRTDEVIRALGGQQEYTVDEKPVFEIAQSILNKNEQNAEYILISGGSYNYSETKMGVRVDDLYVAKYPVTNKLYRSFIVALGEALQFKEKLKEIAKKKTWGAEFDEYLKSGKNDLTSLFRSEYDEDRKFCGDDQPVVGVTWYASSAYCLWLSLLDNIGEEVNSYRLPTEIEWEWAAGGKAKRKYPWAKEKGEPTSKLANYHENVGATTPVGSYPEGATQERLYDMAGNVWEWMENLYDKNAIARSLRGGSWNSGHDYLRCSFRSYHIPDNKSVNFGFRAVRRIDYFVGKRSH